MKAMMKKNDPILTLELSKKTKPHLINADINKLIYELKRQVTKNDVVVLVKHKIID